MDGEIRSKEVAKLRTKNYSRPKLIADLKANHNAYISDAKSLDINLDAVLDMASPGKDPALAHVLEDLNLAMVDTHSKPSSKVADLGEIGSLADHCAAAYVQRLYTIGNRFPRHPLVATFTLSPIAGGTVFNPFSATMVREEEQIEPEIDYTTFLAESWSTLDDTARIPLYKDTVIDRQKRRVGELGEIPILDFKFTEDAKAIYKYGIGIQWSFESAFREVRMQLLGTWVMRQAITDRIWMLMDALGVAIDFATNKSRTYTIPVGTGTSGEWDWDKLDAYNYRWRVPYLYDCMIAEPAAITKFKRTDWGSNNWTLGHIMMMSSFFNTNYEDMRMNRKIKFVDLPELTGEDGTSNAFGDTKYLMMKKSAAIGQVYNTGMVRDSMETIEGNQSYVRRFTLGSRFYGIIPKALEIVTLA
jgi:hypothetical protein